MHILGLIALFIFSVIVISFCKNKVVRIILSILFGTFFVLQIMSLYLGDSFIDYRFYLHFNLNSLEMAGGYKRQIFWTILTLIITPILMYFVAFCTQRAQRFSQRTQRNKYSVLFARNFKFIILIISLFIIVLPQESIYRKLKEIVDIVGYSSNENDDFEQILKNLEEKSEFPNKKFTLKEDLKAEFGGKNIIILSLESFEKAFLHDKNADLAPNLRRLKNEWNFYEMQPQDMSNWTSGSLYTVFTGLPCIFTGQGNDIFLDVQKSKIINIADFLNRCDYDTYHISNNAEFSGTKEILRCFNIENVLDKNFGNEKLREMPISGTYDIDIFDKAKEILQQRKTKEKPFFIWLSTTQLHSPDGIIDEEVTKITGQKSTQLETVAFATDYLVGDFLHFLQNNDFLRNTIVYIFPDHLFMGSKAIFDRTNEPRKLWLMTNAQKYDLQIDTNNFYQIDLAKNIILGAKIKHNATFLSDLIKSNKDEFIKKNQQELLALNMTALVRENVISGNFSLEFKGDYLICLINNKVFFAKNINLLENKNICLFLSQANKLLEDKIIDKDLNICDLYDYNYSVMKISVQNKLINFEWERNNQLFFSKNNAEKIYLNSQTISAVSDQINDFQNMENMIAVVIQKPFIQAQFLPEYLTEILKDSSKIVLMACVDDCSAHFGKLFPILQKYGLKKNLDGQFRYSYVSAFSKNKVYCEGANKNFAVHKKLIVNDLPIYLYSCGFNGNRKYKLDNSQIVVGTGNYSRFMRGLNIAIFDTTTNQVVDAFYVDTYADESLKINR